jgi:hypothetical protein
MVRRSVRSVLIAASAVAASLPVSGQVVISQVYGGGGNANSVFNRDFIELRNLTNQVVVLEGWSVQYLPAGNDTLDWQVTALSGLIHPNGYLLIQEGTKDNPVAWPPLPKPDVIDDTNLNLEFGRVALVHSTDRLPKGCPSALQPDLVDLVGYGDATCHEGSAQAPKLDNEHAALRKGQGTTDTNDNGADFTTGTPFPRNTAYDWPVRPVRRHKHGGGS